MDNVTPTTRVSHYPIAPKVSPLPPVKLPIYLRLTTGLCAVMSIGVVVWMMLVASKAQPFVGKEIFSPAFESTLEAMRECKCGSYSASNDNDYDTYSLATGPFSQIAVTSRNGQIGRVDFMIRGGTLTIGDLSLLWGKPIVRLAGHSALFDWPESGVSANGYTENGLFSYYIPLWHISIPRKK